MSQTHKIKQILKEGTNADQIKRIAVFDFDGTLVDTPTLETGAERYKEKKGMAWPHKGWWGRGESLDMDVFEMPLITSVHQAYLKEKSTPDTLVVMVTGRIQRLSHEVEKILASYGLRFDGYFYNNGGGTLEFKIGVFDELLKEHPNAKSMAIWDDRLEHIPTFKAWGVAHPDLDFNITVVEGNHHGPK